MKKLIRWVLLLSLTSGLCGLGAWAQPFPKDIHRILRRQKIRVAMLAADYPPMLMTGVDGSPQGFDVRLARNIAKELGVEVEFARQSPTFDEVVRQVAAKQADLGISLLTITPARAQMVYFSRPYLTLHLALLTNRRQMLLENKKFPGQDIRDTRATIGVLRGSTYVLAAQENFPRASLKEYDSFADEVAALQKGEILAFLDEDIVIQRYLKKNPGAAVNLHIQVLQDLPEFIGIAVRADSPHLLAWINVFLLTRGLPLTTSELLNRLSKPAPEHQGPVGPGSPPAPQSGPQPSLPPLFRQGVAE
jgi:polar amino acid transport system substrate-binding protein